MNFVLCVRRFDPDWLKMPRHRVRQNINTDNTLSAKEKRYLLGVHMRQGQDLLPRQPSETDLRFLESAYGEWISVCIP